MTHILHCWRDTDLPPDEKGSETRCGVLGQRKADLSAHGITQKVGCGEMQDIKHRKNIGDITLEVIGRRIMGLIAGPVAARIDQNELVGILQSLDIPLLVPTFQAVGKPVLEHQWDPGPFNLVMDANALTVGIGHGSLLL